MTPLQISTNRRGYPKLALVWINFMNYHLARLRAIQDRLNGNCIGIELVGGYGDAEYDGLPFRAEERAGLNIVTLFPDKNFNEVSLLQLSQKLLQTLQELAPEHIALCGYHRIENLAALTWAKLTRRSAILMTESKQDDKPRRMIQEGFKSLLVRQFDSCLVGGISHYQYMIALGASPARIFQGYDAVDNTLFAEAADAARLNAKQFRADLALPERYFMAACRFVPKKNLPMLLEAYRLYREIHPDHGWSLVICGGGPLEAELRQLVTAKTIPDVYFPGFHKGRELGKYYGLASCFIHPSVQEQWGLVVNEAMAAGLPVLVSHTCGCAQNLVQQGVNGFTFDPTDPPALAQLMSQMTQSESQLESMGAASLHLIKHYAPEVFANNLLLAMEAARVPK
jgi:glycosyltransferase involved in cell wall biosynthesis